MILITDTSATSAGADIFNDFMSSTATSQPAMANGTSPGINSNGSIQPSTDSMTSQPATSTASDDVSSLFTEGGTTEPAKNTKESILALYGNTSQPQQMYGVPG